MEEKQILENINLSELKTLQKCYKEYLKEKKLINNLKNNLENIIKAKNIKGKPTNKELEIKQTLKILRNLPSKPIYKLEGKLDKSQKIENLKIENQTINKNILENRVYAKMLFSKKKDNLYNALILTIISIVLFNIGITVNMIILPVLAFISLSPALINLALYITNEELKQNTKSHISKIKLNRLTKKLDKDYTKEKENSKLIHNQNKIFLESKQDIFERMIENHQINLDKITYQIRKIINSNIQTVNLQEEELNYTQTLIENSHQKTLKKSL